MRVALDVTKSGFVFCFFVILLNIGCFKKYYSTVARTVATTAGPKTVTGKTCRLKPDEGPCRGNISMYYFDPKRGKCKIFGWGGCQGNGNRFDTILDCMSTCIKNVTYPSRPRFCNLNFDYGYCFGSVTRYYYDHLWKVCKERIYSGCGGNKNNFYSFEQCDAVCRFGNGKLKLLKKKKGEIRKVIIINPKSATKKNKKQKSVTVRGLDGAPGTYGESETSGEPGKVGEPRKIGEPGIIGELGNVGELVIDIT